MTSVDGFVKHCNNAVKNIEGSTLVGVNAGAAVLATAATGTMAAATHGTLALRGVPGAKLNARVVPATSVAKPTALVAEGPAGLATILNAGTFPHIVGAGHGKSSTGTNKHGVKFARTKSGGNSYTTKLLSFGKGNGAAYGPFVAGGSPAHETLARAVTASEPLILKAINRETSLAVAKAFR